MKLKYNSGWQSARAHVAVLGLRIEYFREDESGRRKMPGNEKPYFKPAPAFMEAVPRLQGHLQAIATEGQNMRITTLPFPPQKNLTKTSAAVGGLAGSQYAPLAFMRQRNLDDNGSNRRLPRVCTVG